MLSHKHSIATQIKRSNDFGLRKNRSSGPGLCSYYSVSGNYLEVELKERLSGLIFDAGLWACGLELPLLDHGKL